MKTIVPAKENIAKLWGHPKPKDTTYRLMRYVLRVDHDNHILLHNVVTGHLIVLDQEEVTLLDQLPMTYLPVMESLVANHFLVEDDFNEYQQVVHLRKVFRAFNDARQKPGIFTYTILPTTACNARCYYCFEQGIKAETMTKETADKVVTFIKKNCNDHPVLLDWFGGEPTIAVNRIDQICEGLLHAGVDYTARMTTNGYLFDEEMVRKAKNLWKLQNVMISVDGMAETYNKTKRYIYSDQNPFERVIHNVGLLANAGILVGVRMNYDLGNYMEFDDLVDEIIRCYGVHPNIQVYVHPVNDAYPDANGCVLHGIEEWFEQKTFELNNIGRCAGVYRKKSELPCLREKECVASSRTAVVITPHGGLARCAERINADDCSGDIWNGETNIRKIQQWREILSEGKCVNCVLFPSCMIHKYCSAKSHCGYKKEFVGEFQYAVKSVMNTK